MTDNKQACRLENATAAPDKTDVRREGGRVNPMSRRALIALAVLCIASFLGHLALLPQMPEMIPTHWDTAGNVNGWTGARRSSRSTRCRCFCSC